MRIAVASDEQGYIFGHLGMAPLFRLYDIEEGKITASSSTPALGQGHQEIVRTLVAARANILIAGGFGAPAQKAMDRAGIRWFGGVTGTADEAVAAYLKGTLAYDPHPTCGCHCGA